MACWDARLDFSHHLRCIRDSGFWNRGVSHDRRYFWMGSLYNWTSRCLAVLAMGRSGHRNHALGEDKRILRGAVPAETDLAVGE